MTNLYHIPPGDKAPDVVNAVIEVPIGSHKYRFLIDGTRWELDPNNERRTKDSLGNITSALVAFCSITPSELTGSFNPRPIKESAVSLSTM